MRWITLLLLVLLASIGQRPLHAQASGIHRCIDRAGHQVFTDRMCSDLDATPALPTGDPTTRAPFALEEYRSPQLCAVTLDDLRQQLVDAFDQRDPNQLAGLMLWGDYSRRGASAQMRALRSLMRQPLLDVVSDNPRRTAQTDPSEDDIYDASQPLGLNTEPFPSAEDTNTRLPPAILLITGPADASDATTTTRFALVHQSGCLWLRPAN